MNTFLRFGSIPENEQSINYFSNELEIGVSVFENKNGMPLLKNLQLCSSLAARIDAEAYEVTGDIVGTGNDGEPLLKNISIIRKVDFDKGNLSGHIISVLKGKFETVTKGIDYNGSSSLLHTFYIESKRHKTTGKEVSIWEDVENPKEWETIAPYTQVCYRGFEFANPIDFDIRLGYYTMRAQEGKHV